MTNTTIENEAHAYALGDTATARLYARIDDLQHALGQAVAALEAIAEMGTNKHQTGAAREALAQIFDANEVSQ